MSMKPFRPACHTDLLEVSKDEVSIVNVRPFIAMRGGRVFKTPLYHTRFKTHAAIWHVSFTTNRIGKSYEVSALDLQKAETSRSGCQNWKPLSYTPCFRIWVNPEAFKLIS